MTPAQAALLDPVAAGTATLELQRVYPFKPKYGLCVPAAHAQGEPSARTMIVELVSEATMLTLVKRGWVKPHPLDEHWDWVRYELTPMGREALEDHHARQQTAPDAAGRGAR